MILHLLTVVAFVWSIVTAFGVCIGTLLVTLLAGHQSDHERARDRDALLRCVLWGLPAWLTLAAMWWWW